MLFSQLSFEILYTIFKLLSTEDSFAWSHDRLLTWNDFQGKPDKTIPLWQHAMSATKLVHFTESDPVKKPSKIKLKLNKVRFEAHFVPKRAWAGTKHPSKDLLKHEQGHFDLAELIARELTEKIIQKLHGNTISTSYTDFDTADKDPDGIVTKIVAKEFGIVRKLAFFLMTNTTKTPTMAELITCKINMIRDLIN